MLGAEQFKSHLTAMNVKWRTYSTQLAVALIGVSVGMAGVSLGYWMGWPGATIPDLTSGKLSFSLSPQETSTMVTLFDLGNLLSPLPTSFLMARYGRKPFLLLTAIVAVLAGFLSLGPAAFYLYLARSLAGIAKGIGYTAALAYLPEISSDLIRGTLSSLFISAMSDGSLLVLVLGLFASYYTLAIINIVIPVAVLVLLLWIPESPYYLLTQGKEKEARSSLAMLRRHPEGHFDLEEEFSRIQLRVREELKCPGRLGDLVKTGASRKALIITQVLFAATRMTGVSICMSYTPTTLPPEGGGLSPTAYNILFSLTLILFGYLGSVLTDSWGRRPPLILSSALAALSTAASGYYYYHSQRGVPVSSITWIPYAGLILFGVAYSLGLAVTPAAMSGELFPTNLRNHAAAMGTVTMAAASFLVSSTYLTAFESNNLWIMYAFFTAVSLCVIPFTLFYVFETKGKTFGEIQDILQGCQKT